MTIQKSFSTFVFGMPQPWSSSLRPSHPDSHDRTTNALAAADANITRRFAGRVARQAPIFTAEFLRSCPGLDFYFVGWDHRNHTVVMRCGPNKRRVGSLLRRNRPRRPDPQSAGALNCDRVDEAIATLLDGMDSREKVSYVLLWQLADDLFPELHTSTDMTREEGWHSIRLTLPLEFVDQIPTTRPLLRSDLGRLVIDPAPPTRIEPDPTICRIAWHEFQQHNPDRQPNWRWDRAHALVRNNRSFSRRRDDDSTGRAIHFLRALEKRPQITWEIMDRFPELVAAHAIRIGPDEVRRELESRLLAGQSDREIAGLLSIEEQTINAYEATFFNVRDRLRSRSYIAKQFIGLNWYCCPRHLVLERLQQLIAYHGGPACLDTVLPYLRNSGELLDGLTAGDTIQDTLAERLRLLIEASSLAVEPGAANNLVRCFSDLQQILPRFVQSQTIMSPVSQIVGDFGGTLAPPAVADLPAARESHRAA